MLIVRNGDSRVQMNVALSVPCSVGINMMVPVFVGGWSAAHKWLLPAEGQHVGAGLACIEGTVLVPQFSSRIPMRWAAHV